ncbi:transglycosylase family protein [Streptomyces sp. 796.1]|uniref:transglycosylase family protein n=1 Tax=Streptomyces sp. 796.1 TaxID=3163029 RepID=UPI0039C9701D
MRSGNGKHRRPRQAPAIVVAAGVTGAGIALPLLGATGAGAADAQTWDRVADCESGGVWSANEGNGKYGGLGLSLDAWQLYGGTDHAPRPDLASRAQQIAIAEDILADRGPVAWSGCAKTVGLAEDGKVPDVNPGDTSERSRPQRGDDGTLPAPGPTSRPGGAADGEHKSDDEPAKTDRDRGEKAGGDARDGADRGAGRDADRDADAKTPAGEARDGADGDDTDRAADTDRADGSTTDRAQSPERGDSGDKAGDKAGGGADGESTGKADGEAGDGAERDADRAGSGRHAGGSGDPAETGAGAGADAGAGTGKHRGEPSPESGADADRGEGATERPGGRHADRSERGRDGVKGADGVTQGEHEVRSGDTLSAIAERHATPGGWPALYVANEKVVGADPDLILPGQKLDLGVKAER